MCVLKKKHTSKLREQPKESRLEKEDNQERELCVEKKIKGKEQNIAIFEKDN